MEPTKAPRPMQSPAYHTYERAIKQYLQQHPEDYQGSLRVLPKDLARLYLHAYQSYLFNRMISERVKRKISLCEPTLGDFTMPVDGEIHQVRMVSKSFLSSVRKEVSEGKRAIVLPLIGYDFEHITFPGPMGEIITSILTEEEVSPEMFRLKHLPWLSSRGSFRSLLVHPEEFSSSVQEKKDPFVEIQFNLRKGSYASVILREFIKPKLATQL